jgi:hypothetical protein
MEAASESPRAKARIVEFRARESGAVVETARDQHLAVRQQGRGVAFPGSMKRAGIIPLQRSGRARPRQRQKGRENKKRDGNSLGAHWADRGAGWCEAGFAWIGSYELGCVVHEDFLFSQGLFAVFLLPTLSI